MIEKIGPIKNPLTIIAIFAAVAEISGTVILPFINDANQGIYIWFLMFFPLILVSSFFLTLNFNHKVLYAPSDYKDEENFIKSLPKASYADKMEKDKNELIEMGYIQDVPVTDIPAKDSLSYQAIVRKSIQATYLLAERLVFHKLQNEFSNEIQRDVMIAGKKAEMNYVFDGIVVENSVTTIIEVKFVRSGLIHRLQDTINSIAGSIDHLPNSMRNNIKLLLAVVTDNETKDTNRLNEQLDAIKKKTSIPIETRLYFLSDLENEFVIYP